MNPLSRVKQENLASSLRAAPGRPGMGGNTKQKDSRLPSPSQAIFQKITGREGLQTPGGYLYDALGAKDWF